MTAFRSFSPTHLAALSGVAASIACSIALGRRWSGRRRQRVLELTMASAIIALRLGVIVWNLLPSRVALARSLPLQICDLAALCSAYALISHRRWAESIAYFFGLALSLQGLIQPDLNEGPERLEFWLFWLHHALIVGTALYLVLVRRFRPTTQDFRLATICGWVYVALIFWLDYAFDANYGYLGRVLPSQPTLLDWLGPWPWRVLVIVVLGTLVMYILLAPWVIGRSVVRSERHPDADSHPPRNSDHESFDGYDGHEP